MHADLGGGLSSNGSKDLCFGEVRLDERDDGRPYVDVREGESGRALARVRAVSPAGARHRAPAPR